MSSPLDGNGVATADIAAPVIRFVIFVSWGNDSIALVQWAKENELDGVACVYTDTGWAADGWMDRVERGEAWARAAGFTTYRTSSIGFRQLAREKKGFPTQRFQWCSYILKIEPGQRWLAENDPDCRAVCLTGIRREEHESRANAPEYMPKSANHGGRVLMSPLATFTAEQRDELIRRAGFDVLPHRSRECKCIKANKRDFQRFTENDIAEIEAAEAEIGRTMYRPHRHMGATGIREVVRWANSPRGAYEAEPEPDLLTCQPHGFCE